MNGKWLAKPTYLILGCLLGLVGCSGDREAEAPEASGPPPPTTEVEASAQVEPVSSEASSIPLTVAMDVVMQENERRRLWAIGETNLPDQTRLRVRLTREASGVSWRARTQVAAGVFEVGPLGPSSGLVAGDYTLYVSMPPAELQVSDVKAIIGEKGEFLEGPYVERSPHGLGNIIEYATTYEVVR